jgi:hypothetical protein
LNKFIADLPDFTHDLSRAEAKWQEAAVAPVIEENGT